MPDEPPDRVLGIRPTGDLLAREVARTKIADALFDTGERVRVGRYQLLGKAGAGGMGVVWSAWDPELERRIAIKLVRFASPEAREHMIREGQALAKLSHPHVVPIYDVGAIGDQVYLVMEWISGATLRTRARERSVRELVAIYRAAGSGLVAAHRAGIVHGDFKPDNVMIDDDARVRVLDFGLARPEDVAAGGGTPKYMAPEQAAGKALGVAVDQYAFCVALRESLRDAPPAWIAAIVARGTAADPKDRYPDLEALLAALDRDPERRWRKRALAAGVVVAAAVAFALGTLRSGEPEACSGADGQLARVWNPARRAEVIAHARALGPYGDAESTTLATALDQYGARWIGARRGACLAQRRDELTPRLYERGLACLERARAALDATAAAATRATLDGFANAVLAARDLPDAERCITEATTDPVASPARSIAPVVSALGADATRASYLALAADPAALPLARTVARAAAELGYRPLVARAQLALGQSSARKSPEAITAFAHAADAALAANDDATFVEAFARELFDAAPIHDARTAALVASLPLVRAIGIRAGDAGRFARALLYNNAGTERLAAGDPEGAIAWLRAARAEPEPENRGVELWVILGNLAMVVDDRRERETLFTEEHTRLDRLLGPTHAFTVLSRQRAAMFVENPIEAAAELRSVCDAYARFHPELVDKRGACNYELGWLARERDDRSEATTALTAVVDHPVPAADDAARTRIALATAMLGVLRGDSAAADRVATGVAQAHDRAAEWWDRLRAADAWLVAADARSQLGRRNDAIAAWRSALAILVDPRLNARAAYLQRRLALARAHLAVATGDRGLAALAIAWYRDAGGYDRAIVQLTD